MRSDASNQTMMTVVSSGETRWCVRAICFDTDFHSDAILPLFSDARVLLNSPVVLEFKGSYSVFLPFGVLLYWAGTEQTFVEVMRRIETKLNARSIMVAGQNELQVSLNHAEDAVHFRDVELKQLSVEHIKVISETFGQSLALHRCQATVQDLLARCRPPVQELLDRGDIRLSSKALLKLVGNTLALREETLSRLALIDTPPEAWHTSGSLGFMVSFTTISTSNSGFRRCRRSWITFWI